jgi:hypothetical protein
MNTSIKTFACTVAISTAFLACNDTGTDNNNSVTSSSSSTQSSNFCENPQSDEEGMPPVMDCRVVSFQKGIQGLGYGDSFTTDEEILKSWFPHIFNGEQAKSECNYFAFYSTSSYIGMETSYFILSQDMTLYRVSCTWSDPPRATDGGIIKRAMLICDDKEWTLKESIDLDSTRIYEDPNWECGSGIGGPNWDDVYF